MTERQRQYFVYHQDKIEALQAMWEDSRVQLYNDDKLPSGSKLEVTSSVFLAGPTSRNQILEYNWRCEAVALLRTLGFDGWIFCPEPRGRELSGDFTERSYVHDWESKRLMKSLYVAFWIPRKTDELLGLNTNLELGLFLGKCMEKPFNAQYLFVGWPHEAERMGLPKHYVEMAGVHPHSELFDLCKAVANAR